LNYTDKQCQALARYNLAQFEEYPIPDNWKFEFKNTFIRPRISELPSDVKQVIFNNKNTVVILNNGIKGVAKCSPADEFDPYVGFVLAYYKAKNKKNHKLHEIFDSCITTANKKGYAQAILKNY
jgi:hypothetical protein